MEQVKYNRSRVCQMPPTLIEASGKWYPRPWASIFSLSVQTKAASLQLTIATLYLIIGGVSSYASDIADTILFSSDGAYWYAGGGDTALSALFMVTILPLSMSAIAFILFYGFYTDNKKSWRMAILLNLFGLSAIVPSIGVLDTVLSTYSNPSSAFSNQVHSYTSIWGSLIYLVPLLAILSFTLAVYLSLQLRSPSMADVQDYEPNELQQLKGIKRRRKRITK